MTPQDCQLPPKFREFYPGQEQGIVRLVSSISRPKRATLFCAPTGFGKTPALFAACKLFPGRKLILTGTIPLQQQFMTDFESAGLVQIKGQRNYKCLALDEGGQLSHYRPWDASEGQQFTCEQGPCKVGERCELKREGCTKYDAIREVRSSEVVIANYAYWMAMVEVAPDVLGEFDLIICDEGHTAADWVVKFSTVEMSESRLEGVELGELWDLGSFGAKDDQDIARWKEWAKNALPEVRHSIGTQKEIDSKDYMNMELLFALNKLERDLIKLITENVRWVVERSKYRGRQKFTMTPLWAAPLAEKTLFAGIEKIVLTSATITEEVGGHLGLASEDFNYIVMPSTFDPERRTIIYVKF